MGQCVAVSIDKTDSSLHLHIDDVDHGVVAAAGDIYGPSLQCHVVVDLYGCCDKLSVADSCADTSSLPSAVSDYQEKAAKENGNYDKIVSPCSRLSTARGPCLCNI